MNFFENFSTRLKVSISHTLAHFTVTVANEAGVDLVLIQPFLLYDAKLVVDMLTSIF